MTRIKPRTRGKHLVRRMTRLDRENDETLQAYAAFIGEDADYVLNQLIDAILARDKDFVRWRRDHGGPIGARPAHRGRRHSTIGAATAGRAPVPPLDAPTPASPMVS